MAVYSYFAMHFLVYISIIIILSPVGKALPVNVAAASNNATCSSSQPKHNLHGPNDRPCAKAIDGLEYGTTNRWTFTAIPVGVWLSVTFACVYSVSAVQIMPLFDENKFEMMSLTFDSTSVNITLTLEADDNNTWTDFNISPPIISRTINLTILSAHDPLKKFNGLSELRVYGTLPGTLTRPPPVALAETTTATAASTTTAATETPTTIALSQPTSLQTTTSGSSDGTDGVLSTTCTEETTQTDTTTFNYTIIIGSVAGGVAFVALVGIVVALVHRRRKRPEKESVPQTMQNDHAGYLCPMVMKPDAVSLVSAVSGIVHGRDPEYVNVSAERPILVSDLAGYLQGLIATPNGFKEEFLNIPEHPAKTERSRKVDRANNRYNNIVPYDHSRVMLSPIDGDPDSDYINANTIDWLGSTTFDVSVSLQGYRKQKKFIATQGPNDHTTPAFWRMVWEQNSTRILILTNLVERGRHKCAKYWQDEGGKMYGDIDIQHLRREMWPDFVVRTFRLKKKDKERFVKQYHFTAWPDEGAPENGSGLLNYRQKVQGFNDGEDAPIIVHCSAGVGRTGTYIALNTCLKRAEAEHVVDVCWSVHLMRLNRINMVQTMEQYVFIYSTLVEALLFGGVSITCTKYKSKLRQLLQDDNMRDTKMAQMYQVLEILKPSGAAGNCVDATTYENQPKNRFSDILPAEWSRPRLMLRGGAMTSDYINAVFVHGYRKKRAFIATQMPLPNTQVDFWRMVDDFNAAAIVMINPLTPGDETAPPYWPEDKALMQVGPFTLKTDITTTTAGIKTTDIELATGNGNGRKSVTVRHFRLLDWPEDSAVPACSSSVLQIFAEIKRWKRQHDDGVVIVHCSDGVKRCGFLCALSITLDKIDLEHEVDVFNSVKSVRMSRPGFIPNIEQFEALYRFADDYMDGLSVDANFR